MRKGVNCRLNKTGRKYVMFRLVVSLKIQAAAELKLNSNRGLDFLYFFFFDSKSFEVGLSDTNNRR